MGEEMLSIQEALTRAGFKPREPTPGWRPDYARDAAEHWERQKPLIWPLLLSKGVPAKLVNDLQTVTIAQSGSIDAVGEFSAQPSALMLAIIGDPQVGKSLAAAYWLSKRWVARKTQYGAEEWRTWKYWDSSFAWIRANDLGALTDRFDQATKNRMRELETTDLLVVDEVGGQSWSDVSKRLDDLLGIRWGKNLRTVLTANLDLPGLREALGDRIVERIMRCGMVRECRGIGEVVA